MDVVNSYVVFDIGLGSDIGGRTVWALPRETQVTGQMRRQENCNLQRGNVIIALPYIG